MKFALVIFIIILIVSFACTKSSERFSTNPNQSGDPDEKDSKEQGKIVFVSDRDTKLNRQIYLMNIDGSHQVRITRDSNDYLYPIFSPDGSKILCFSNTKNNSDEIYVMNVDGSNLVNLSNNPGDDNLPSYNPDGSKIVFTSSRDGNQEIYIMESNGQNQTRLTSNERMDHSPQFTDDGLRIIYYSSNLQERDYSIHIMDIDGNNKKNLTENKVYYNNGPFTRNAFLNLFDARPCISPDGSRIVFISYDFALFNFKIFMMNFNGENHQLVTDRLGYNVAPVFSPDGLRIIFRSHRGNNYDIYETTLDGEFQKNLTNDSGHSYFSHFSPDGSKILYNTDRDQYYYYKIWIMNRDGSKQTQLTFGDYNDYYPKFQPIKGNTLIANVL